MSHPGASASRVIDRYRALIASRFAGVPFLVLRDVALQHGNPHRRPAVEERGRSKPHLAPNRNDGDDADRRHGDAPSHRASIDQHKSQRCRNHREQSREAVHADKRRQLRNRQRRHLAVAEERPRKAVPDILAAKFRGHPDGRRQQERTESEPAMQKVQDERESRWKEREVGDQHAGSEDRTRRRKSTERRHRGHQPIQRACEVDGAAREAEQERAACGRSR